MNDREFAAFKAGFGDGMRLAIIVLVSIVIDLIAALLINIFIFGTIPAKASVNPDKEPLSARPEIKIAISLK